jgi:hypothetical protein
MRACVRRVRRTQVINININNPSSKIHHQHATDDVDVDVETKHQASAAVRTRRRASLSSDTIAPKTGVAPEAPVIIAPPISDITCEQGANRV